MLYTKKLNLNLPEDGDQYDVNLFNENARIIDGKLSDVSDAADAMTAKIPSAASAANQLADKGFVHDAIATNTAYFIGTFDSVEELEAYDGDLTNNDYAFVETTDTAGNVLYQRYKYNERKEAWEFEYSLNNTGFTAEQMDAINSGATAEKIGQIKTMTGAKPMGEGEAGFVPKPPAGAQDKVLHGDGKWRTVSAPETNVIRAAFPSGRGRWLVFDFSDESHKSLKIKKDTHLRLQIKTDAGTDERWLDILEDTSFDLSEQMQAAADASSARQGQLNGRDFYLYLVPEGTDGIKVAVSCNPAVPGDISPAYTSNNTRKIGQFHTLCADAGTYNAATPDNGLYAKMACAPGTELNGNNYLVKKYADGEFADFYRKQIKSLTSGTQYDVAYCVHPLDGFLAGDILPESVWCTTFRPRCSPDGMVYDADTDMAIDIYLQSGRGEKTVSAFGGVKTNSRQQQNHQDDMRQVGKRLLYDHEFSSAALGSNENSAIASAKEVSTTGGHVDTKGRRMVSAIGCEDMCGLVWQFLSDTGPTGSSGFNTYDGQAAMGQTYGAWFALLGGGYWNVAGSCGSRARDASRAVSYGPASFGGRGASRLERDSQTA